MKMNPVKWVMLAGALALSAILALYLDNITVPVGEKPVQAKDLGGQFQLKNLDGTVDLSEYQGKAVIMYFGYLNCAEVCPTSMSKISAALSQVDDAIMTMYKASLSVLTLSVTIYNLCMSLLSTLTRAS